jgi:hypothetical protein
MRNYIASLSAGASASAALTGRGGVNISLGNKLVVTQTGSPSMAVIIRSGAALIPGTESGTQGSYGVFNDADVTLSVTAAHPTLPRIDIVAFKVQDSQFSGATNSCSLVVVAGTAAGSPTPPAAPANSIVLANIAVGAAVTSITNANITDKRVWLTAAGGVMVVSSTTRPAAGTVGVGQVIYETDTLRLLRTDDGGTTWLSIQSYATASVATGQTTASTTYADLATVGPSVTLTTGTAVKITITAAVGNTLASASLISFAVSGATTIAALDLNYLVRNDNSLTTKQSGVMILTGLTPGSNTFTVKYRVVSGTGTFTDRILIVEPL